MSGSTWLCIQVEKKFITCQNLDWFCSDCTCKDSNQGCIQDFFLGGGGGGKISQMTYFVRVYVQICAAAIRVLVKFNNTCKYFLEVQ